jgi:hypothetical protein
MQKAAFRHAKHRISPCKRPPFAIQKTAFYSTRCNMLTFRGLQATTHIDAQPIINYALRSMNQPEVNYEPTRS